MYDLTQPVGSPCVPKANIKRIPDRTINIKGYVAELVKTDSNSVDGYQNTKLTYFLKLYHYASLVDEIKIYVKIYPEKVERFMLDAALGVLIELKNVRQCFSNELNFIFRYEHRPDQYTVWPEEKMDTNMSFKQRLRVITTKEPIPATNLALLSPMCVNRSCLKVKFK